MSHQGHNTNPQSSRPSENPENSGYSTSTAKTPGTVSPVTPLCKASLSVLHTLSLGSTLQSHSRKRCTLKRRRKHARKLEHLLTHCRHHPKTTTIVETIGKNPLHPDSELDRQLCSVLQAYCAVNPTVTDPSLKPTRPEALRHRCSDIQKKYH